MQVQISVLPPAVSACDEAPSDGPDEHPSEDGAADEALLRSGYSPIRFHGRPHEGEQHDLERLRDPAQAGVS